MHGIIACETLYDAIETVGPDAEVRYLPHDLHEFPVNVGDDRKTGEYVAEAIADLESAGVDSITIAFAGLSGLDGLASSMAPIRVSLADECVSTFRYRAHAAGTGEVKEPGVYYLTRGHIDRAVDGYKLALAYRGEIAPLEERFDEAAAADPSLRVDWQESTLFQRAVETGGGMSLEAVDRFFGDILGYYHTVELIDTGSLGDVHHWYADAMASYISRVGRTPETETETDTAGVDAEDGVTVRTAEGDLGLLELLLSEGADEEPCDSPYVACFEPGERIDGR